MINLVNNLTKAIVNTITIPVAVVADVITLGGALSDKDIPYTATQVKEMYKNLTDAGK